VEKKTIARVKVQNQLRTKKAETGKYGENYQSERSFFSGY
jgi:hypothetical protein